MLLLLLSPPARAVCQVNEAPELVGWSPRAGAHVRTQQAVVLLQWSTPLTEVDPGEVRLETALGVPVPTQSRTWREGSVQNIELTGEETLDRVAYRVMWQGQEVTHFLVTDGDLALHTRSGRILGMTAESIHGCPGRLAIDVDVARDPGAAWYRAEVQSRYGVQTTTHLGPSLTLGSEGCGISNARVSEGELVFVRVQAVNQDGEEGSWSPLHSIEIPRETGAVSSGQRWERERTWGQLVQTLTVFVVCLLAGAFMGLRSSPGPMRRLPAWMRGPTPMDGS